MSGDAPVNLPDAAGDTAASSVLKEVVHIVPDLDPNVAITLIIAAAVVLVVVAAMWLRREKYKAETEQKDGDAPMAIISSMIEEMERTTKAGAATVASIVEAVTHLTSLVQTTNTSVNQLVLSVTTLAEKTSHMDDTLSQTHRDIIAIRSDTDRITDALTVKS